ncbi:hypothetical protein LK10_17825 [Sinomonas humi]|uniref:Uncharacterized protein n=1 Tax=Sinomonas humi TaxID=1338436 RepID=A0A0B2ABR4_9MICC|nr:hypothetical protein LK10_17825 [Sinomonas humi]
MIALNLIAALLMLASGVLSLSSHIMLGILQFVACMLAVLNALILYQKRRREPLTNSTGRTS